MHAHIIYGVDDGAQSIEESIHLIKMAYQQGVKKIIATPHSYSTIGVEIMKRRLSVLQKMLANDLPEMELFFGEEILYSVDVLNRLENQEISTLAGSRYVLVEFQPVISYKNMLHNIRNLMVSSYIPILAHVERYACLRKKKERLDELKHQGTLFQMNYLSLSGNIFDQNTRWCRKIVLEGKVDFLSTDMHRPGWRPPDTKVALTWLKKNLSSEHIAALTYHNALAILHNRPIRA